MSPQGEIKVKSVGARPEDYATGLNANAVITLDTAPSGHLHARWELSGVAWSYNAVPTGGRLTIFGGGFNFDIDITNDGPGFIPFNPALHARDGNPIIVTLYAGGAQVRGKLNLLSRSVD